MTIANVAVLILILGTGAALRLPQLGLKPMHTDEAVQADILMEARESGRYRYDPTEYHGPTLPLFSLLGAPNPTEVSLRTIPVLFSLGLLLLLPGLRDGLGRWECAIAGVLLAVSPIFVYFSRYYIHETLLVFFTLAVMVCGWRYATARSLVWAVLTGVGVGMMHATKETCVMAFAAMSAGVLVQRKGLSLRHLLRHLSLRHLAAGGMAALVVSVLLFSWFFTNPIGPLDSIRTYASYLVRSEGSGHEKSLFYYGWLLAFHRDPSGAIWSEGVILLLGLVGLVDAFRRTRPFPRFLAVYTVVITVLYSVIPYKTPWLAMSILLGMALLAGTGLTALIRVARHPALKTAVIILFVAGAAHLAQQSSRATLRFHSDERNPYVYSPTSPDLVRMVAQIETLARLHPDGHDMVIKVISPDYWPLPWYLRKFTQVGYWTEVPEDPDAPIVLVAPSLQDEVDAVFQQTYVGSLAGLRPSVLLVHYTEDGLWADFINAQE